MRMSMQKRKKASTGRLVSLFTSAVYLLALSAPAIADTTSQSGAQNNASSMSSGGSTLSLLMGVVSVAGGGYLLYTGGQDMATCASSWGSAPSTTPGGAQKETAALTDQQAAETQQAQELQTEIQNAGPNGLGDPLGAPPADVPTAPVTAPAPVAPAPAAPAAPYTAPDDVGYLRNPIPLFRGLKALFLPLQAQASACVEGPIKLLAGGLFVAMGVMAIKSALDQKKNADTDSSNSADLCSSGTTCATPSPTPAPNNLSGLTVAPPSSSGISFNPSALKDIPGAASTLGNFSKAFGMTPEQLADALGNGADPADLLSAASNGALTPDQINKAMADGQALSDEQKKALLDKYGLSGMANQLASGLGTMNNGGGGSRNLASNGGAPVDFSQFGVAGATGGTGSNVKMSDSVKAALAKKLADDRLNGITNLSIFEVVHSKYQEKFHMTQGDMSAVNNQLLGVAGLDGQSMSKAASGASSARKPASK